MENEKEEKVWREWFEKQCGYDGNEPLVHERIKLWSKWAWFECGKRKDGEIEGLKARIKKLEQAIQKHKKQCWPKEVYNGYDEELYKVLQKPEGK